MLQNLSTKFPWATQEIQWIYTHERVMHIITLKELFLRSKIVVLANLHLLRKQKIQPFVTT
jgi:hypothetical protein